jgi:hypothetical protein
LPEQFECHYGSNRIKIDQNKKNSKFPRFEPINPKTKKNPLKQKLKFEITLITPEKNAKIARKNNNKEKSINLEKLK